MYNGGLGPYDHEDSDPTPSKDLFRRSARYEGLSNLWYMFGDPCMLQPFAYRAPQKRTRVLTSCHICLIMPQHEHYNLSAGSMLPDIAGMHIHKVGVPYIYCMTLCESHPKNTRNPTNILRSSLQYTLRGAHDFQRHE